MQAQGKEVKYLLFSNEGHGFSHPENLLKFCTEVEAYLHEHLGGSLQD
jgi:dipeptidyl aminopeptidase/acylaminoacyl peptidase